MIFPFIFSVFSICFSFCSAFLFKLGFIISSIALLEKTSFKVVLKIVASATGTGTIFSISLIASIKSFSSATVIGTGATGLIVFSNSWLISNKKSFSLVINSDISSNLFFSPFSLK